MSQTHLYQLQSVLPSISLLVMKDILQFTNSKTKTDLFSQQLVTDLLKFHKIGNNGEVVI